MWTNGTFPKSLSLNMLGGTAGTGGCGLRSRRRSAGRLTAGPMRRTAELPADVLRTELIQGVFHRLRNLLPFEAWSAEESAFRKQLQASCDPAIVADAFDQCYRYFALGKVMVKDLKYNIHDLTGDTPIEELWSLDAGDAVLEPRVEADRPVGVIHYDLSRTPLLEVSSFLEVPFAFDQFKRLEISFRRDQTWHELRVLIEMGGAAVEVVGAAVLGRGYVVGRDRAGAQRGRQTAGAQALYSA